MKDSQLLNNESASSEELSTQSKAEKSYHERKQELINHFITHTLWVFINEINQSYPYDLSQADISQYKNTLRCQLNIPAYPITDEEFDEIINKINIQLKEFVTKLIIDDEKKRNQLNNNSYSACDFHLDNFEEENNKKKM